MNYYPLTPKMYAEMQRLGETRFGVMKLALCEHFGIDQTGKSPMTVTKILDSRLTVTAKLHGMTKKRLSWDIIDAYLNSQPVSQARSPEEIDKEIAAKLDKLAHGCRGRPYHRMATICRIRQGILKHRLHVRTSLSSALSDRAKIVGKTEEEIERDLLCIHFGIR